MRFADRSGIGVEGLGDGVFEEGCFEAGAEVSSEKADEKFGFEGREGAEEVGEEGCLLEGAFGGGNGLEEEGEVLEGLVFGGVVVLGWELFE